MQPADVEPLAVWRRECPITEQCVFFNHAGVSPLPQRAVDAATQFCREASTTGVACYEQWEARAEAVRALFAQMINARAQDIAFVKNTSAGLSLVAAGLPWEAGDSIITYNREFPANLYPWWNLRDRGVTVHLVGDHDGRILLDDIAALMDETTRLVSLSSVQFATGFRADLDALGALCRERGVLFCVDAIQSVGAFPIDVRASHIDFLAADGHKWLLGPEGVGFFYCAPDRLDQLKLVEVGWKSVVNAGDYLSYDLTFRPDAARFEPGSLFLLGIITAGGSLSLLSDVGIPRVAANILDLTTRITDGLTELGYDVLSPRAIPNEQSGIVTFTGNQSPGAIVERLDNANIHVAARGGAVRVSPHFYNAAEEVERFLTVLGPTQS